MAALQEEILIIRFTNPKRQTVIKVNKVNHTNLFIEFIWSIANTSKSLATVLPSNPLERPIMTIAPIYDFPPLISVASNALITKNLLRSSIWYSRNFFQSSASWRRSEILIKTNLQNVKEQTPIFYNSSFFLQTTHSFFILRFYLHTYVINTTGDIRQR